MSESQSEDTMAAALEQFGWTCTEEFWQWYYQDPWVFNLANAVETLDRRLRDAVAGSATPEGPNPCWCGMSNPTEDHLAAHAAGSSTPKEDGDG